MVNKKGKGAKAKGSKPPIKKPQQVTVKDLTQQSPQERVALVRPLWETLQLDERAKLLSIDLEGVRARAKQLAEAARQQAVADAPEGEPLDPALLELEPSIEDVLEEGIRRLKEKGTWKLWQWPADNTSVYDAESFRQHITEKHIREELRRFLPREEGRSTEKPAEAAFRQRMLDLLSKVQQSNSSNSLRPTVAASGDESSRAYRRRGESGSHLRDANIELLAVMLEALAKENDHLYHSLLTPITTYVMEILPEGHRETTKLELSFEDLENLLADDVSRIVEWLTEKVDALSTKLKPEHKDDDEEEEENMGDVDLWALTEDGSCVTVNAKWLQHLQQERVLGEDGHPRRAKPGEDAGRNGLVLEWVYGSIVSTAEKARDGAKRCLGMQPPTAADAHLTLLRALDEHLSWETRAKQCKDFLSEMLKSRLEVAELAKQGYDLRPQPKRDLPGMGDGASMPLLLEDGGAGGAAAGGESKPLTDEVILFMLRREALLTRAKLHFLIFEHLMQEKELRILKQALRQGEPEFERLKRELDEVKHQPRGMEGAYRSAAEMERHRHQLEVQTAFREQGARLQATYDKKQKAEYEMAKRETEIKQLQGWKGTVDNLVDKFQELINTRNERLMAANGGADGTAPKEGHEAETDLEAASGALTPQQYIQLTKMRNHFNKDVRKQLYGDADDRAFFDNLKTALKAIERRLEDSSVALQHLEMQLINVACDDPGAIIGAQLALPLLQERLDQRGLQYAAERAKLAEDEVLRMELLAAEREAAEKERKKAAKAKKNEKAKSEKERQAAERQAKEQAERAARQEAERERVIRDEEERRKRLEAVEAMRKAEEVAMEQRRKELLSDENGYWRQRMILEERMAGMGMGVSASSGSRDGVGAASSPEPSEEPEAPGPSQEDARRTADDDEGFVTESRRRRHKDTRDQDEEVSGSSSSAAGAAAAGASGGGGGSGSLRSNLRSGSRDRVGPAREGLPPRERGEHNHRGREPRRQGNQAPVPAAARRSGSREAGSGRQGGPQGGPGAQHGSRTVTPTPLPPTAPPAAAQQPTPAQAPAAVPAPAPEGAPLPAPAEPKAAAAAASAQTSDQPAAPASPAPAPAPAQQQPAAASASPAPGLRRPSPAAVPEEAILFGDIAVIPTAAAPAAPSPPPARPTTIPIPVPVLPAAAAPDSQQPAAAPAQAVPSAVPQQPQPTAKPEPTGPPPPPPSTGAPAPAAQQQQQPLPGPPGGHPAPPKGPQPSQPQAHVPAVAPGQPVHHMGPMPPMPPMVPGPPPPPAMMPPMPAGGPRPQGAPSASPQPPFLHVNGPMPVPMPAPGGPMPPMGPVLAKQMPGPPPGTILVPIPGPPGARPHMPGPGMPPGPPQPGMQGPPPPQPMMQVAPPPQQQPGPMGRPPGPMGPPQGPMHGMPAPGPQGGMVAVPHPQGPGHPQHGHPAGGAPRGAPGAPGQHMMVQPMQFPGPMHGGAMAMPHGQPPSGPMGHVPPQAMYVFPPGGPALVQPGPGGPMPGHPHMLHVLPGGMAMPMGGPPQMSMQQPPQPQQPPQQSVQGSQPPPPPKSPSSSSGGAKPSSTLNANARSFVPSGKPAAPSSSAASVAQPSQPQQQPAGMPSQQQGPRPQYPRPGATSEGVVQVLPPPSQQPHLQSHQPQPYRPSGPYGGPGPAGGPYGNRRDRREGPRGGSGPRDGPAGGMARKGLPVGPGSQHGAVPQPVDMSAGQPMPPPAHGAPHPLPMMGAPLMVMMGPGGPIPVPPPPSMPHDPGMEAVDGAVERQPRDAPDGTAEDPGRASAEQPGVQPSHAPPQVPGPAPPPHHVAPPPPPGMAAPGHGPPRMMLVLQPGMPGPVQVPAPIPMMPGPMMPMHLPLVMQPVAGPPAPGPSDGPMQKNGSAAESVRAPRQAQSSASAASSEADGKGASDGGDSAATASATAPNTVTNDGQSSSQEAQAATPAKPAQPSIAETLAAPPVQEGTTQPTASQPTVEVVARDASQQPSPSGGAEPRRQQQQRRGSGSGSSSAAAPAAAAPPPGRGAGGAAAPTAPAATAAAPSWSAVAARREGGSMATCSTSSSGNGQNGADAFPSLVGSTVPTSSSSDAGQHPHPPAAASSWKAKLQQNAASSQQQGLATGGSGGGNRSPGATANGNSPNVLRGASPRGTLHGGVQLASSLSDSAMAHSGTGAGTGSPLLLRPAGNRPSGPALLTGPPSQLVGSLSLSPAAAANSSAAGGGGGGSSGVVYHPGTSGESQRLQLVRGLQNLGGQHNCFLNVTIQSLWHLRSFRDAVLRMDVEGIAARGAVAADVAVLRALVGVFRAMAAPLVASGGASSTAPSAPSWVVSPLPLREALSLLETGQSAVRLDLSEMHDAFEVLLVLLTCMHRAEAGSCASQGQDPQLPRRVRVRDIAAGRAGGGAKAATAWGAAAPANTAMANGFHHAAPSTATPSGYAAAVSGGAASQQARGKVDSAVPSTAAHSLFGLDVQVPCTAEEEDASGNCSGGGKERQHQPQQRGRRESGCDEPSTASSHAAAAAHAPLHLPYSAVARSGGSYSSGSRGAAADESATSTTAAVAEVEVYTKYFHLVHAQALRKAFAALDGSVSGAYFEDVLCAAEAAGSPASTASLSNGSGGGASRRSGSAAGTPTAASLAHAHGWTPGATAAAHPLATLLRFPAVFTLALVWESPQAPLDALRGTLEALGPRVDLALLFRCGSGSGAATGAGVMGPGGAAAAAPASASCELRSVICYFGHHYLVFALSEELGLWLMIDDANIQLVGHWSDVVKAMVAKRLQPSLLFYETERLQAPAH
ncbi:hypothetical protein Agub_g15080 [Astrephomene gubernaculifera]|uniref:USP domain-containing protein n=1 Tax=Astrephomene gubernaculifera TaxID=47775 RepID=A0AAD3HTY4_9CHLO|nr:hypothetical protein Agub_g15080 [Astrephomene gubernaculifera]